MGWRFRQSIKLFPGVRINVAKRGLSVSFGVPGATVNLGRQGVRATAGLPGSGISYSERILPAAADPSVSPFDFSNWLPTSPTPEPDRPNLTINSPPMREIASAGIENLTSEGLSTFRQLIIDARRQRQEIETDLAAASKELEACDTELTRRSKSWFRMFYKKRIAELHKLIPSLAEELKRLRAGLKSTYVDVKFDMEDAVRLSHLALIDAFDAIRRCQFVWDVTADIDVNRFAERSSASRAVSRRSVSFVYASSDLVRFAGRVMALGNANGEDLLIYPSLILMPRSDGAFALLDLRDVELAWCEQRFNEEEQVPADTEVIDRTWARINKDGSADRRFKDNYEIPVCRYGRIRLSSPSGLREEYLVSNAAAALTFGVAFDAHKKALSGGRQG